MVSEEKLKIPMRLLAFFGLFGVNLTHINPIRIN